MMGAALKQCFSRLASHTVHTGRSGHCDVSSPQCSAAMPRDSVTCAPCPPPQVRKKRFTKLQEERSYWSKKPAKKTSNERRKKAHHRPKH